MRRIRCEITRSRSEEPWPGWVEARLVDAFGREWLFHDKPPVFGEGVLGCELLGTRVDPDGRVIATIDTERPWGLQSTEGVTTFEVTPDQFVPS